MVTSRAIGVSIGVVGVWRDASRRATSPRAVRVGFFARLPASRVVRSAPRWPRGGSSPRDAGPMWERRAPHYDSMVAKLIAYGANRNEAIARMRRALDTLVIEGIKTTVPLHRRIMDHPDFVAGTFSTKWMETFMEELKRDTAGDPR